MGNCIRRETGIEREEEDKVKREEMIMHIVIFYFLISS